MSFGGSETDFLCYHLFLMKVNIYGGSTMVFKQFLNLDAAGYVRSIADEQRQIIFKAQLAGLCFGTFSF